MDYKEIKERFNIVRAKLHALNQVPSHLRTKEQEESIKTLTEFVNENHILLRAIEFELNNKTKVKSNYQTVMRPKTTQKLTPSGSSYTEKVLDRQGNPIMEKHLESKRYNFTEEIDQDGNKVWHVSKFIQRL